MRLTRFLAYGSLFVVLGLMVGCGADAPAPRNAQPTQTIQKSGGKGFWCLGKECFRTERSCYAVREKESRTEPCQRGTAAFCFDGTDPDNMVSWTFCYLDGGVCRSARESTMLKHPDFLEYTPCQPTR